MQKEVSNIELIGSLDFDFIESLSNDGTNYLINFDDSCDEIYRCKEFEKKAFAGRHRKLICIYIKRNLLHESANGKDIQLQNTRNVLFKSPRDVQQIDVLGKQFASRKTMRTW